jgi:hypothetical protein
MSKTQAILRQLLRGLLGAGFLAVALIYSSHLGWWTMVPALGAVVLFRGCPMCWTIGLIEAAFRPGANRCEDGSCASPESR